MVWPECSDGEAMAATPPRMPSTQPTLPALQSVSQPLVLTIASDSDNSPPGGWSTAGRSCRSARCSTPTCRRRCCGPWRPSSSRRTSAASAGSASRRRTAPGFDRRRYWRGPVWANLNWLLARGLRGHGLIAQAAALERTTLSLIERTGMRDYFDPLTGDGLGSDDFSWTAAVAVDMLHA